MQAKKVLIMAGGTGGHVIPGLTIAHQLKSCDCDIGWLGTPTGIEASLVPQASFPFYPIQVSGLRGKGWRSLIIAPWQMVQALHQSYKVFRQFNPDLVIGMGGYAAGPGGIMAKCLGKPLFIHEQNTRPGLTNRILKCIAKTTFQAFPNTFKPQKQVVLTGNPVRQSIMDIAEPKERLAGRDLSQLRILVLGGSQGAQAINEAVIESMTMSIDGVNVVVRHQCGTKHLAACEQAYKEVSCKAAVTDFIDDMAEAYRWADLVIARAGALTVSEIAASGSCSILIPHPYAVDDHQTFNARYLSDQGGARLLPQDQMTPEKLSTMYAELAKDREQLVAQAEAARRAAMPNALADIVGYCLGEKNG